MQNPFNSGYYNSSELAEFGFKEVGENVCIAKTCQIVGLSNISIGPNTRIDGFCTLIGSGPLNIARNVHIHPYCQLGARGGITLGDYVALASGCLLYSASDSPLGNYMVGGVVPRNLTRPKIAPISMKRHSGAFARCTILPGVTFEEGSMACAHSLISRDVAEWTIVAGAPAIVRSKRSRRILSLEATLSETPEAA